MGVSKGTSKNILYDSESRWKALGCSCIDKTLKRLNTKFFDSSQIHFECFNGTYLTYIRVNFNFFEVKSDLLLLYTHKVSICFKIRIFEIRRI